ncbi:MAG: 3-oxoacyl-[acyl-carrier protein] reductase [bacterium]|jgi:3-oxoacyl-[acyl-carrier protein] reductase
MSKKLALVLGGNGGIGSSATRRLIEDGMHVCAIYNNNRDQIDKLKDEFSDSDITDYQCNLLDSEKLSKTICEIKNNFGNIDVVVFTLTSSLKNGRLLELEWKDYQEHFELQLKTMFYVTKVLKDQICAKHKTKFIVVLTEYCIGVPPKGLSYYVTSKYAAMGMAKSMAVELAQYGCNVNMISPGMVETPLLDSLPSKLIEITAHQNPLKRNAVPEDISNAISYLASDQSDYLNGTNIVINGGGKII